MLACPMRIVFARYSACDSVDDNLEKSPKSDAIANDIRPSVENTIMGQVVPAVVMPVMADVEQEMAALQDPDDSRSSAHVTEAMRIGAEKHGAAHDGQNDHRRNCRRPACREKHDRQSYRGEKHQRRVGAERKMLGRTIV